MSVSSEKRVKDKWMDEWINECIFSKESEGWMNDKMIVP